MDVIEMLKNLFESGDHQARWADNPEQYLEDEGASDVTVAQINEAAQFAVSTTDLGANVNVGGNQTVGDAEFCQDADQTVDAGTAQAVAEGLDKNLPRTLGRSEAAPAPTVAPPPPPTPSPMLTPIQQVEETINYYVTNVTETNVDDRDTMVDNSVDVVNVGGQVTIDQETTIASGDEAQAVGGDNNGAMNSGDHGVAVDTDGGDAGPIGTGSGNVVDNSTEAGEGGTAEGGDVIIGDDNEKNDVDVDFGEGGGGGGDINIGVGSGDTSQDNHTEDNDGVDYDDNDGVDYDDNDGVDDKDFVDDKDVVDYDDNDGLDIDAELDFGRGREAVLPERKIVEVDELVAKAPVELARPEEAPVAQVLPQDHVIEEVQPVAPPVEELQPEEPMVAELEPVELVAEEAMDTVALAE